MQATRIITPKGTITIPVNSKEWNVPEGMSGKFQRKIRTRLKGFRVPTIGAVIHFARDTKLPYLVMSSVKETLKRNLGRKPQYEVTTLVR